jgi:HPt (histidine-containing phosphotransfer) domain-containing protein
METRIVEFANVLRRNGVRVSVSENMDAFRALEVIGIGNPTLFRSALRTTLIKRAGDIQPFEELFNFFFLGIGEAIDALDRRIMEELGLSPQQFQEMLEQIQKFLREMEGDLSELTQALLSGNRGELERLLREAVEQEVQNGSAESFRYTPFTRMAGRLQMDRVQSEIERFKGMLQMLGQNGEDLQKVSLLVAIDQDAQVEFLLNGQRFFDQQSPYHAPFGPGLVRDQRHAEHLFGQLARFLHRLGDLHPPALATASGVNLRLHYDAGSPGVEQGLRHRNGLPARRSHFPARHGHTKLLQDRFRLVLMNFHNDSRPKRSLHISGQGLLAA